MLIIQSESCRCTSPIKLEQSSCAERARSKMRMRIIWEKAGSRFESPQMAPRVCYLGRFAAHVRCHVSHASIGAPWTTVSK